MPPAMLMIDLDGCRWIKLMSLKKQYAKNIDGALLAAREPANQNHHLQHILVVIFIATILRLQALTLTTAARYRRALQSVKIVAPTLFFRVPFLFTATMSSSADLSASLQVKKLSPTATLPTRGSPLSAGFDLSANEKKVCYTYIIYAICSLCGLHAF